MTPTFEKIHLKFKLNGINYDRNGLKEVAYSLIKEGAPYEKAMGDFLMDWLDNKDYINVRTSGSTGQPKLMQLSKQAMVNSSIATGNYFKMKPGQTALLCLPTHYIAGKMMLVRAMVLGLELDFVEPSTIPVFDSGKHYDFCAMIPIQLQKSIKSIQNIKILIVGGASVSKSLEKVIQKLKTKIYATYGMTETVSHVAVKRLNGPQRMQYFKVFPKVKISQDDRRCLVIEAPKLAPGKLVTNDVVEIHGPSEFELIGRLDNVINSGGVKLFPEQIEAELADKIDTRFFIGAAPDPEMGERPVLVVEGSATEVNAHIFEDLPKLQRPKAAYVVPRFHETSTGKIQRRMTMEEVDFTKNILR